MRIAFLTPEYPHPNFGNAGGIGSSLVHLIEGLKELGHEISVIIYGQTQDAVFVENAITFYQIKNIKVKGLSLFLTQRKVTGLINNLYDKDQIDIVEAPDWTGFTSFVNPKCPIVLRLHGSDTYFCHLENRPIKSKNKWLEKRAFKNADAIISVSNFTGKVTNSLFDSNRKIYVIPNGVGVDQFKPVENTQTSLTILYFGTLIRKKGALELPYIFNEVIAQNPEASLVLAGSDSGDILSGAVSTWELMKPLFSETALKNTSYEGKIPYREIQQKIAAATLCVFPTFAEALPVSWIEAMAMAKPIVASNIGWATELIKDGKEGFLVHPTSHKEYAGKILQCLNDVNLSKRIGENARAKVIANFTHLIVAKKSADFYEQQIKKHAEC